MTGTPSKREQLREERRQQIIDAALFVFTQKGFHAANVSDVAAQAGVSQGTIYWYFESKEELLMAALLSFVEGIGEQAVEAMGQSTSASEKLRVLARTMADFPKEAAVLFPLFLSYWSSSSKREEAGRFWVELLVEYKDQLVAAVDEGMDSGEFRPVDAEALVWAVMAAYDGLAAYLLLMPDLDPMQVSRTFIEILIRGLEAGK
jgi:AcrR family transcriptional regulator